MLSLFYATLCILKIVMIGRIIAITGVAALATFIVVITTTSPSQAGAIGILGVFFLLYLLALSVLTFLLLGVSYAVVRFSDHVPLRSPPEKLSVRQAYYYASVIAILPVVAVSLQSVGGVGVYELLLMVVFVAVGCVYVSKRVA